MKETIAAAEEYYTKFYVTKEISFHQNATSIELIYEGDATKSIIDGLTDALTEYKTTQYPSSKESAAEECFWWIRKAEAYRVIQTGQIMQLTSEIDEKTKRLVELEQKNLELQKEYDALFHEHQKTCDSLIDFQGQLKNSKEFIEKYMSYFPKGDGLKE